MTTMINRLLLVIALAFGAVTVWMVRDMFAPTPFAVTYELKQIEGFAAAARADAYGENPDMHGVAQDYVIETMMRYIATHPKVTPIDVLQNALTLYPEGWSYAKSFWGRRVSAIKYSFFYHGSSWDEVYKRALDAIRRGADPIGCATHYVRAKPGYGAFTNEGTAAQELLRTMVKDPHQPSGLKMIFLCPKT